MKDRRGPSLGRSPSTQDDTSRDRGPSLGRSPSTQDDTRKGFEFHRGSDVLVKIP